MRSKVFDPDDNLPEDKSHFWLFPPLPNKDGTDEMSAEDEAELKKRNQRRDDIRVYLMMALIVVMTNERVQQRKIYKLKLIRKGS